MQIEKILETAEKLKLATLQAKELGVIKYIAYDNSILVLGDVFKELFKNKEYELILKKPTDNWTDYTHNYVGFLDGMTFETFTIKPLFEKDEVKSC